MAAFVERWRKGMKYKEGGSGNESGGEWSGNRVE